MFSPACFLVTSLTASKMRNLAFLLSACLHSQLGLLKCRSAGPLKCHGRDTETDEFAICQVGQLLPPTPPSPSREASRNLIASNQGQRPRGGGSWFLITGLPSFEYQTSRLSHCCTKMKRNEEFFGGSRCVRREGTML